MKQNLAANPPAREAKAPAQRQAESATTWSPAESTDTAATLSHGGQGRLHAAVNTSPRQLAQRQSLGAAFGPVAQMASDEDSAESAPRQAEAPANSTGMPDALKAGVESLSGMDLSDVRVHRNSSKPAQLNALPYAQGNDIHLGPGQEQHLSHEAWHVVQQRQGRVQPTLVVGGTPVNDNPGLEHEADVMGAKALQRARAPR